MSFGLRASGMVPSIRRLTAPKRGRRVKGQQFHALALVSASSPCTLALKLYLPEEPTSRLPPSLHKRLQMLR